jgi:predicted nucleic acid-binding protein
MTYCDSSFLASLYVATDVFNPQARREASRFTTAIPYTLLNELELLNALRRGLGDNSLDHAAHDAIIRDIDADEADGLLKRASLNQIKLYEKARELSKKHTPTLACRSLDILHVASALVLGAERFASFDQRQRKLAAAVSLSLVPSSLPK